MLAFTSNMKKYGDTGALVKMNGFSAEKKGRVPFSYAYIVSSKTSLENLLSVLCFASGSQFSLFTNE